MIYSRLRYSSMRIHNGRYVSSMYSSPHSEQVTTYIMPELMQSLARLKGHRAHPRVMQMRSYKRLRTSLSLRLDGGSSTTDTNLPRSPLFSHFLLEYICHDSLLSRGWMHKEEVNHYIFLGKLAISFGNMYASGN